MIKIIVRTILIAFLTIVLLVTAGLYYTWQNKEEALQTAISYLKTTEQYKRSNIRFSSARIKLNGENADITIKGINMPNIK